MSQINIGKPIDTSLIKCCSCGKGYNIEGNIYENNILVCPHCGLKHKIDFTLIDKRIESLKKVDRLNLTVIDIGNPAIVSSTQTGLSSGNYTAVDKFTPANATGKITIVEIYAKSNMTGVEVATFYASGNNLTTRDYETVDNGNGAGVVLAGSKQTFTVELDVQLGDFIGIHYASGDIFLTIATGAGLWYKAGDNIPCSSTAFTLLANYKMSLHGIGATEATEQTLEFFETLSIVDTMATSGTLAKAETLSIVDTKITSGSLGFIETLSIVDSWSGLLAFFETLSIVDSKFLTGTLDLTETLEITDLAVYQCIKTFYETLSIIDSKVT